MRWFTRLRSVFRNLFRRGHVERDLTEELEAYVELLTQEKTRTGLPRPEARRAALLEVGGVEQVKERVRAVRTGALVLDVAREIRLSLRSLGRAPGFTAALLLSLALGVGATTAAFTIVDGVLLRPLPYERPEQLQLVRVWWGDFSASLSPADLLTLEREAADIAEIGAWFLADDGFTLATADGPRVVQGAALSRRAPDVFGVQPLLGDWFTDRPEAREVLIGEALWRDVLGGAPDATGRSLELDGEPFTVVGVMPAGFGMPGQADGEVWMRYDPPPPTRRGPFYWSAVARVRPPLTPALATERLTAAAIGPMHDEFGVTEEWRYGLRRIDDAVVGSVRPTLSVLLAAGALVLLVGVFNFANLLLARGLGRSHDLGIRIALGAGRARVVLQLVVEAALVGAFGGVIGLSMAALVLRLSSASFVAFVPRMEGVAVDAGVVAFALAVGVSAAVVPALAVALRAVVPTAIAGLRGGGRVTGASAGRGALRGGLVVGEVALTLTVLTAAGLLARSFRKLEGADPGFDPSDVLTFRLVIPEASYPGDADGEVAAVLDDLRDRLRGSPDVKDAGYVSSLPPDLLQLSNDYVVEGESGTGQDVAQWIQADPGYFPTMGIRMVRGRAFTDADRAGDEPVAIVDESFARRHFEGGDALGRRLHGGDADDPGPWTTVVGVAQDVSYAGGVWAGPSPTVYLPLAQSPWQRSPFVVVRTLGEPSDLVPTVRAALAAADPEIPLRNVATMEQRMRDGGAAPRLRSLLFSALAVVALVLAFTGIFGVLSHDVRRRRRETAVMRALGASARGVVRGVVGAGMRLVAVGVAIGVPLALAGGHMLRGMLFGVAPTDALTITAAVLSVGAAGVVACSLPAMRAARADPMAVLREE